MISSYKKISALDLGFIYIKTFIKHWSPVLFWAGFIFFVSSLPADDLPGLFWGQDILFHIFEYAILALFLNYAFKKSTFSSLRKDKRLALVILFCLIYAVSDELHQQFVPGRISSIADLALDSIGILLGSLIKVKIPHKSIR